MFFQEILIPMGRMEAFEYFEALQLLNRYGSHFWNFGGLPENVTKVPHAVSG